MIIKALLILMLLGSAFSCAVLYDENKVLKEKLKSEYNDGLQVGLAQVEMQIQILREETGMVALVD